MPQYRPKDVAQRLGVSPSTLRAWSDEFAAHLSPAAQRQLTDKQTAGQRRYAEEDVAMLLRVKHLLRAQRLSAEEAHAKLAHEPPDQSPIGDSVAVTAHGEARDWAPVVVALEAMRVENRTGHERTHQRIAAAIGDLTALANLNAQKLAEAVERLEATEQRLRDAERALERERSKGLWDRIRGR